MSARQITKEVSNKVANLLVKKKKEELTRLESELNSFCIEQVIAKIPTEVMLMWENPKTKHYVNSSDNFCFFGEGLLKSYWKRLKVELPKSNYTSSVILDKEDAATIVKKLKQIENLGQEIEEIVLKFETAIYNLRSYTRIEKEFPEAYLLIPREEGVNLPSLNLQEVRELAKNIQ